MGKALFRSPQEPMSPGGGVKSLRGIDPGLARCSVSERRGLMDCAQKQRAGGRADPPPPFLENKKQFKTPPKNATHFSFRGSVA